MTLADQMASDVTDVFLNTDEHATSFTYTPPLGGTPGSVTGIWELGETKVEKDHQGNVEVVHPATLLVESGEVFAREGILTVANESWPVTVVGKDNAGMRVIQFERRTKVATGAHIEKKFK